MHAWRNWVGSQGWNRNTENVTEKGHDRYLWFIKKMWDREIKKETWEGESLKSTKEESPFLGGTWIPRQFFLLLSQNQKEGTKTQTKAKQRDSQNKETKIKFQNSYPHSSFVFGSWNVCSLYSSPSKSLHFI